MRGVCFFFDGPLAPMWSAVHEADLGWVRDTIKQFGFDTMLMVDQSQDAKGRYYQHTDSEVTYARYGQLSEAQAAHPDVQWLLLEHPEKLAVKGATDVHDLWAYDHAQHQDDVIYCVGSDATGIPVQDDDTRRFLTAADLTQPYATAMLLIALTVRHTQVR